jgi:hypothetical protein
MSGHDQATVPPLLQRPVAFWLILLPMVVLVLGLIGGIVLKDRAARTALAEHTLRYEVQARAIDEAHEQRTAEEGARRSASMR